ncbi:hypothetical protein TNCT_648211 [Trichonephila clavata]|uniref:Uncharacterized protein n=1 Tax=Trichonephila clavata TaxID=2740835 RepID=A0A8X6LMW4_TRICU|nr:hypothetical protein TNCT_648211 [Trichonephila clavata]
MRRLQALRERTKTTKAKLRKRVKLKLRLSEYSQKLQNSVFKRRAQQEVNIMEICVVKERRNLCGTERDGLKSAQKRPLHWTASGEKLRGEIGTLNGKFSRSLIPRGWRIFAGIKSSYTENVPPPLPQLFLPQTNTFEEEPRR